MFLVAWIVDQLIPPIFSVNPPSYIRLTGMFPALAIVVGLGMGVAARLAVRRVRVPLVGGALALALVGSTVWTVRDYFVVWAPSSVAYAWMMGHKVELGEPPQSAGAVRPSLPGAAVLSGLHDSLPDPG